MSEVIAVIAVLLAAAIAVVLILALRKPDTLRVQRVASIKAPPEKLFALISDFREWRAWSPYEDRDPNLQRSYGGAASGRGAARSAIASMTPRSTAWLTSRSAAASMRGRSALTASAVKTRLTSPRSRACSGLSVNTSDFSPSLLICATLPAAEPRAA